MQIIRLFLAHFQPKQFFFPYHSDPMLLKKAPNPPKKESSMLE